MTRRAAAVLLFALALAVAGLVLINRPPGSAGRRRFRLFLRVTPAAAVPVPTPPLGATPAPPHETVRLTLFFPGREDAKLRGEERDIAKPAGPSAYLKSIFAELRRGPTRPELFAAIPPRIELRNAFLLPEGMAVLDLSVDAGLSFGSDEELTIVASLVDTVLQNVADTNRVRILVNGEPAETLRGHVDLSRPLSYLRGEIAP
jgi:germination protein M